MGILESVISDIRDGCNCLPRASLVFKRKFCLNKRPQSSPTLAFGILVSRGNSVILLTALSFSLEIRQHILSSRLLFHLRLPDLDEELLPHRNRWQHLWRLRMRMLLLLWLVSLQTWHGLMQGLKLQKLK